jgi:hypothetical protein
MTAPPPHAIETVLQGISESMTGADREKLPLIAQIFSLYASRTIPEEEASTRLAGLIGTSEHIKQLDTFAPPAAPGPPSLRLRRTAQRWTPEEDRQLTLGVEQHGVNNWQVIANLVGGNRTKSQCAQRWFRGIDPRIDKGNWSFEEEQRLIELVEEHGIKAWTRVAQYMQTRSDVQCRFRWQFISKKAREEGRAVAPISPPASLF